MKKIILALSLLGLAGCSYSESRSGTTSQQKRVDQQNLQTEAYFKPVIGTYSGVVHTTSGDQSVELILDVLRLKSETLKNADGKPLLVATPTVSIARLNPVKPTLSKFIVNYNPSTGDFAISKEESNPDRDDLQSFKGVVMNGRMTGEVYSEVGRKIGDMELKLVVNQSGNDDNNNSEAAYYKKLAEQFLAIAGKYSACVIPTEGSFLKKPYLSEMYLSVNFSIDGNGNQVPNLSGYYHRMNDKAGTFDSALKGAFRPDLKPATLIVQVVPKMTTNGYVATLSGTITGTEYKGSYTSNVWGMEGNFFMKLGATPTECVGVEQ